MKINVYTSCYSKMLARHKNPNDIYIQISRSLFLPRKGVDNKSMASMIDINYGQDLGMYENTLQEYAQRIKGNEYNDILQELTEIFTEKFLLADMTEKEQADIGQDIKELETELNKSQSELNTMLANYESLPAEQKESLYFYGLTEKNIKDFASWKPCLTYNFFILCFEDLETKYTEKDEKKNPDCKAGTFKTCHRTALAEILNERYNLNITEW